MDYRWAAGNPERINSFAKELVQLAPDVIFTNGTAATAALQRETRVIAIVFAVVSDPIGDGFVVKLGQPTGNIQDSAPLIPILEASGWNFFVGSHRPRSSGQHR